MGQGPKQDTPSPDRVVPACSHSLVQFPLRHPHRLARHRLPQLQGALGASESLFPTVGIGEQMTCCTMGVLDVSTSAWKRLGCRARGAALYLHHLGGNNFTSRLTSMQHDARSGGVIRLLSCAVKLRDGAADALLWLDSGTREMPARTAVVAF